MRRYNGIVADEVVPSDVNTLWINNSILKHNVNGQWKAFNNLYPKYVEDIKKTGQTPLTLEMFTEKILALLEFPRVFADAQDFWAAIETYNINPTYLLGQSFFIQGNHCMATLISDGELVDYNGTEIA